MQVMGNLWSERTEKRLSLHPHGKVGLELSRCGIRSEGQRQLGKLPGWGRGESGTKQTLLSLSRSQTEQDLKMGVFQVPF